MTILGTLLIALSMQAPNPAAGGTHAPTFTKDIAPIVFANCTTCHRTGEVAPFPLTTYSEVRKKATTIRAVVEDRFMPPWHPEPGFGIFRNSLRLSDAAIKTIVDWVETGMTEGPKEALPALPKFPTGWQLGTPDLVLQVEKGYEVPAAGRDIYRNFVIMPNTTEDRWISALEVRPSARGVLHHIVFLLDETGEARKQDGRDGKPGYSGMRQSRGQMIDSWAVGGMPQPYPEDLGVKLPKGADLILQSHFHMSGKKESEQTTIGIYFTKQQPKRTLVPIQLPPFFGIMAGIDIPAGDAKWQLADSFTLPCDVDAFVVGGHGHMLLKTLRMTAELGAGKKEPLLLIKNWDFDWQNRYVYEKPLRLTKGAEVRAELIYDNSATNPNNPSKPPKRVKWGEQTTDEMGSITVLVAPANESDLAALTDALRIKMAEKAMAGMDSQIDSRFKAMDKNGDGKITREEVPRAQQRFFELLDGNHDGALDKDEVKKMIGASAGAAGGLPGGLPGGGGRKNGGG